MTSRISSSVDSQATRVVWCNTLSTCILVGTPAYQHQVRRLVDMGDIVEVASCPGLYVQREGWEGFYDPVMGAKVDSAPGDPANYVSS